MSLSSASSFSEAGTAVIQQGLLTFVAGQTCTVPCPAIKATDAVVIYPATSTAGAAAYAAALTNHIFTLAITAGTGFTLVGVDALYAGTVRYVVLSSSLPAVNITSA
jgi:hypothetical protein